jgi:L-aspartate oxidase
MGGVKTDLWGSTTIPGLFAAGETACTGVHGANRLASNSLLEGLVFGERSGLAAARHAARSEGRSYRVSRSLRVAHQPLEIYTYSDVNHIRTALRRLMWEKVGIVRHGDELTAAVKRLQEWERMFKNSPLDRDSLELRNMVTTALLITRSALQREGSVGAHFRRDFPAKGRNWKKRIAIQR